MHVMFRVVLITSAILLCSCQKKSISDFSAEPHKPPVTGDLSQNKITTSEYKEVWMMRGWQGYMCVIIALKEKEYDVWFSSCSRGGDSSIPLKGTYTRATLSYNSSRKHEEITLIPNNPEESFYSLKWETQLEGFIAFVASPDDLENNRDSSRWLRSIDPVLFSKHLADSPFLLHMNPQLENEQ